MGLGRTRCNEASRLTMLSIDDDDALIIKHPDCSPTFLGVGVSCVKFLDSWAIEKSRQIGKIDAVVA